MSIINILFWSLSFITIFSIIGLILINNIIYCGFLLGLSLISIAGLFLLLNADFIAIAQILIYVGAINILILFAIMLVDKKKLIPQSNIIENSFIGIFCLLILFTLVKIIHNNNWIIITENQQNSSINIISKQIFTHYLLSFEIVSILLLSGLIGAILIAKNENLNLKIK
uniref:NAD(P)H-quinone oxidoreductase subunit 6, chloroplastic n=1 Tax=Verdigellas peltata TaxID=542676 RepID=A0A161KG75_9VIRI|nr:NADH dehydrogenase subunit 6 [Verdigellas peltata]CZF96703.1 NADH dehydrogenase subunit 6 [Verdigellas peltata]